MSLVRWFQIHGFACAVALLLALAAAPLAAPAPTSQFYSHDGTGNNVRHPAWGSAGRPRIRSNPPLNGYADGSARPRTEADGLPSAWRVLSELFRVASRHENKATSQLLLYFGQFIAHDITRSAENPDDEMAISCGGAGLSPHTPDPVGALNFCPAGAVVGAGSAEIPFFRVKRSADVSNRRSGEEAPVQSTINFATAYLDLDHLYGPVIGGPPESDVRTFVGGKMVLDANSGLPPRDADGRFITADPQTRLGPSLTALAAVFLRYHNLRADAHAAADPSRNLTDEELYWAARMDTVAAYQNMVEEKYIPTTLGEALDPYAGYDADVDPSIDVFFSTCAFRYGHSGLSGVVRLLDPSFRPTPSDPVLLRDAFDRTEAVLDSEAAAAAVLRGMAAEPAKATDASFVDDVAFFTKHMAVRNVQRGRDSGLPSYNNARAWFNLSRVRSMDEVAGGDENMAMALSALYGSVDDVEPYVGGLLELPSTPNNLMGPLMTASMKEQFARLRDGDRLWYKARLTEEEVGALPSLSDMIKMTFGEVEMRYFPADSFAAVDQLAVATEGGGSVQGQISADGASFPLFDGAHTASWALSQGKNKTNYIYMKLLIGELVQGGYVGIGWGSQSMRGAEIWFCTTVNDVVLSKNCTPAPLSNVTKGRTAAADPPFSCCVAPGLSHSSPRCAGNEYPLDVVDSCISQEASFVTFRAPICKTDKDRGKCFHLPQGEIDFIAAYSPSSLAGPHGFSRRTMGRLDLNSGWGAAAASDSANGGLFALHGGTMLICWFGLVPAAIYIVRYMKGKSWRLFAHITLVGIVGSLVFAVATAAIVSVEGTSFGTAEGGSAFSEHKIVGLCVVAFVLFMLITGETRRTREIRKVLRTRWIDQAVLISHRCGGFALLGLSWWNCYTGLVQISAYESDDVEITWAGTRTTNYNMKFFGIFKQYFFFPLITVICLIFLITEIRMRRSRGIEHSKRVEAVRRGSASIWGSEMADDGLQVMSVDTFLELTRNGSAFCIVDGFVIDIGSFMDIHPGGSRILRFAIGSDISEHLIGQRDVDGIHHVHSPVALRTLRSLVKAKLDIPESDTPLGQPLAKVQQGSSPGAKKSTRLSQRGINLLVFRDATIVDIKYVTTEKKLEAKPVVRVRLALKKEKTSDVWMGTPWPSTTFIFRGKDSFGGTIERPYTPVKCYARESAISDAETGATTDTTGLPMTLSKSMRSKSTRSMKEEVIYEFLINLVPEGLMSSFLMNKKPGSHIMVKGPLANETVLQKINSNQRGPEVILIAAGTGLAPMLQLIDYYCDSHHGPGSLEPPKSNGSDGRPKIFLAWIIQNKSLSFEGAADLRERSRRFHGNFRYLVIYHGDSSPSMLCKEDRASMKPALFSSFRKTLALKMMEPTDALNNGPSSSALNKREFFSSLRKTLSLERMEPADALNSIESAAVHQPEASDSAYLPNLSFHNEDVAEVPAEEGCTPGKSCEHNAARREFLDLYRVKGHLDKELIAKLLSLATDKDSSLPLDPSPQDCVPTSEEEMTLDSDHAKVEDEEAGKNKGRAQTRAPCTNLLVAVCGRPAFDDQCAMALKELGLDEDQIVLFRRGSVPFSTILLLSEKMSSRNGECFFSSS